MNGAKMLMWTVIDKKIYLELDLSNIQGDNWTYKMYDHIKACVSHKEFPKRIQFWTRVGNDEWQ